MPSFYLLSSGHQRSLTKELILGGFEISSNDRNIAIHARSITKVYSENGQENKVLDGLEVEIYEDESVAIVGASGVGKTTLLHIIGTLDKPNAGKVVHFGKEVLSWPDKRLSRFRNEKIGFVFQFHHLLPEFNALENVLMPCYLSKIFSVKVKERALELLDYLGLKGKEGLNVKKLSGGEQQRVALARALINNPRIILADEPTGNLDEKSGLKVAKLLFKVRERSKATLIIVTHNLNLARMTDRCIGLKAGKAINVPKDGLTDFVLDEAA